MQLIMVREKTSAHISQLNAVGVLLVLMAVLFLSLCRVHLNFSVLRQFFGQDFVGRRDATARSSTFRWHTATHKTAFLGRHRVSQLNFPTSTSSFYNIAYPIFHFRFIGLRRVSSVQRVWFYRCHFYICICSPMLKRLYVQLKPKSRLFGPRSLKPHTNVFMLWLL